MRSRRRSLRKIIKKLGSFPNGDAVLKLLYLVHQERRIELAARSRVDCRHGHPDERAIALGHRNASFLGLLDNPTGSGPSPQLSVDEYPIKMLVSLVSLIPSLRIVKHAWWLNMIEIGVLATQCLECRIDSYQCPLVEPAAQQRRPDTGSHQWMLTTERRPPK